MGQIMRSKAFLRYDYGMISNRQVYGQSTPPEYPLEEIDIPVALFYGKYDSLSTP
jgi:lysosomal acid lipase/cholesteryl ester hydrolase